MAKDSEAAPHLQTGVAKGHQPGGEHTLQEKGKSKPRACQHPGALKLTARTHVECPLGGPAGRSRQGLAAKSAIGSAAPSELRPANPTAMSRFWVAREHTLAQGKKQMHRSNLVLNN